MREKEINQIIGRNVKTQRKHIRMTQAELAKQMGIKQPFISHLEKGKRVWTIVQVSRASNILYRKIWDFIDKDFKVHKTKIRWCNS